jgi:hypothetical protein
MSWACGVRSVSSMAVKAACQVGHCSWLVVRSDLIPLGAAYADVEDTSGMQQCIPPVLQLLPAELYICL